MRDLPYWRVSPKFWPDTVNWTEDGRTLALYLLTCPHRTTEGLFVLPLPYIWTDLGWPQARLADPLAELIARGFIEHDSDRSVFMIMKALEYQSPANPNSRKAAVKKLSLVPSDSPLTCTFRTVVQQLCPLLYNELPDGFGQPPALPPPPAPALSFVTPSVTARESEDIHSLNPVSAVRGILKSAKSGRAS